MTDKFGSEFWHQRFQQQAEWTKPLRDHFFKQFGDRSFEKVLEVGCGTGAVLGDLGPDHGIANYGLDIDYKTLEVNRQHYPAHKLVAADGFKTPFSTNSFDLCFCHFLFLWVTDPSEILKEMVRITKPDGIVAAFAEPDYGGRIDSVDYSTEIRDVQIQALRAQGADPEIGRKLPEIFSQAGLEKVQSGILGAEWRNIQESNNLQHDFSVLINDLDNIQHPGLKRRMETLAGKLEKESSGISYVPTFYAWGTKRNDS